MALARNMLALTVLWDGIPIVYAGQEQHYAGYGDPGNREATWLSRYSRQSNLYTITASANQVRNHVISIDSSYLTYNLHAVYNDENTIPLRKGYDGKQIISVFTSTGFETSWTLDLANTGWSPGTTVYEVLTCKQATVSSDGTLFVPMENGQPRIYFATQSSSGSGICGSVSRATEGGAMPSSTKESVDSGLELTTNKKRGATVVGVVAAAAGAL